MAYWPFSKVKSKVREYAGKPTEIELTDANLLDEINFYLVEVLPLELMTDSLRGYWVQSVASELVTLPDSIISIEEPMTLDYGTPPQGYDPNYFFDPLAENVIYWNALIVYTEPQKFFEIWPNNQTWTVGQPYALLLYGRKLLFRPPPDQTYTFRSPAMIKASALVSAGDVLLRDLWGQFIAYAVAHKLVSEEGDAVRESVLIRRKAWAKGLCDKTDLINQSDLMLRPVGRW